MKKILVPIIIILIVAVVGLVFLQTSKTQSNTNLSPTDGNGNKDVVQYAIDMDNYNFSPKLMKTQPGTSLKVKITNKIGVHSLKIDKLNFDSGMLSAGESKIVTIQIPSDASGDYEFYCGVIGHKALGMIGKLQVSSI
jgi:plastocyanin